MIKASLIFFVHQAAVYANVDTIDRWNKLGETELSISPLNLELQNTISFNIMNKRFILFLL